MAGSNPLYNAEFGSSGGDIVSEELVAAWKADPRCAQCGEPVRSVLDAALLVGSNRVAHKERCFIPALIRGNPHLKLFTARQGAQEGGTRQGAPRSEARERTLDGGSSSDREAQHG
jgi:hypothetical protein